MLSRRQFAKIAGASLIAAPALAESFETVRVTMAKVPSATPVFVAQQRGYFRDAGIEIEPSLFDANQKAFLALVAGSADVAFGSMTIIVINIVAKGGLKIIAGRTREAQGARQHAILVSDAAWDGGLRSLRDLKGRRIGTTTGTRYFLGQIAAKYGFTLKDVTIVPLQPGSKVLTAFQDNQLDAIAAGPPVPTGGHILAWAGDEVPWQSGAICTTPATIRDRHAMLERFLSAYTRGVTDYIAAFGQTDAYGNLIKGPGADEFTDLMANKLGVQRSDLVNWPRIDPDAWLDGHEVNKQIAFWRAEGLVDKTLDPESILDRSFGKID